MSKSSSQETRGAYEDLLRNSKSLMLATSSLDGIPESSTTPYIRDDMGQYYIFVSQLARHTQNLINNPNASIMLVEDENDCRQYFARKRIQYQCKVEMPDDQDRAGLLKTFSNRYGNVVELLSGLPDFRLFRLKPLSGQFVMGFGQAYTLTGDNQEQLKLIQPG